MTARSLTVLGALLLLSAITLPVAAQDTSAVALPGIEIEASRQTEREATAPFAVTIRTRTADAVALDAGLSLAAVLGDVPGLWLNDRGHYALGERVSVRGMGWRAAFGVRGVQVVLDDVPLTMPDGQAVLDVVDPAYVRRAELIRGPSSLYWGNGSGGTLYLSTFAPDAPRVHARALAGTYGTRHLGVSTAARAGANRFAAYASDVRQEGYRAYSAGRFTRAALSADLAAGARARLRLVGAVADQDTENPGSLTRAQADADPSQANARNVSTKAGKRTTHLQGAASLLAPAPGGMLTATVYGLRRDLDNPLSFAYIGLTRTAGGARLSLQHTAGRLQLGGGVDGGLQHDDRFNRNNVDGRPGPTLHLDQLETVRAASAFVHARLRLSPRVTLQGGLRHDALRFTLDDRLTADGDDSGSRSFGAWSPAVALALTLPDAVAFAGYSTAFEAPTTTELVNRPSGAGGFNPALGPQKTAGVEVGIRGAAAGGRVGYDLALFRLSVTDRLTPFQTTAGGDRTYYRNEGRNRHDGVEAALDWHPRPDVRMRLVYAGSRFRYRDGDLRGNHLPGQPDHRLAAGLVVTRRGVRATLDAEAVGAYFVDDANTARNDGYIRVDVGLGHTGLAVGGARLQPLLAVRNLLDARYNGSVIINASGGRFYEPSPGRAFQAGIGVSF